MSKGFCWGFATAALAVVALQGSAGFAAAAEAAAAVSATEAPTNTTVEVSGAAAIAESAVTTAAGPTAGNADTAPAIEPQAIKASTGAAEQMGALRMVVVLPVVRAALSRSSAGLREQRLPGPAGGIGIDLQGRFQSAVVAARSADGRLSLVCTDDDLEATPASAVTVLEVKP